MLKPYIKQAMANTDLSKEDVITAIGHIMDGEISPAQIAAFLIAMRAKGETVPELAGAATAMRARMTPFNVSRRPLIDTCGTGGSGKGKFNISTAVAFVVATGGVAVAKHGNRAITSRSGSADVLDALGVNIAAPKETVEQCVNELGIGFLFAPNCHPAMKHAGPVRRELGVRTLFNVLGPLTNPAGAPRQLMGVFDKDLTGPLAQVLGDLGSEFAWVIHGEDGLDEITVCGKTHVAQWDGSTLSEFKVDPEALGLSLYPEASLSGGTPEENASTCKALLKGEQSGAIRDVVALNAAAAFLVSGEVSDLKMGLEKSFKILDSGQAFATLERLISLSASPA